MNNSVRLINILNDTDSDKDDKINNLFDFATNIIGLECKISPENLIKEGRKISRRERHKWRKKNSVLILN